MGQFVELAETPVKIIPEASIHESLRNNLVQLLEDKGHIKNNVLRIHCTDVEIDYLIKEQVFLSYGILVKNGISGGISIVGEHQFLRLINAGLVPENLYSQLLMQVLKKVVDINYVPVSGVIPRNANVLFLIYRILHTVENVSKFGLDDYMFRLINTGMLSLHDNYLQISELGKSYLSRFKISYLYADSTALLDFLIKRINILGGAL